jgi:hypothetical protein
MRRVISFCIFGSNQIYLDGLLDNISLCHYYYPGWSIYIYGCSLPSAYIEKLTRYTISLHIRNISAPQSMLPLLWRFEPILDQSVDLMIVRDADSRIGAREALAVSRWVDSDKVFHVIRDHPYHTSLIQAGMFGVKKSDISHLLDYTRCLNELPVNNPRVDEIFLSRYVYPYAIMHSFINARYCNYERQSRPLPGPEYDHDFIGQRYHHDGSYDVTAANCLKRYEKSLIFRLYVNLRQLPRRIISILYASLVFARR